MADEELREAFARDVVLLKYVGLNPVIVHGGGPEITDYMQRLGLEVEFVQGLRVSDEQTVEVAKMVLIGKLNKDIVLRLNRHGQSAVGPVRGRRVPVPGREAAGVRSRRASELDLGLRRLDPPRRRERAEPHRGGLHPGGRIGGRGRRGALVQRERGRGGRRGGRGARRLQGHLPDRRRGLARRPGRPGEPRVGDGRRRRSGARSGANDVGGGMLPEAAGVRGRGRGGGRAPRTSWTGASRTRCCWSCSRMRASGRRWSGDESAVRSPQCAGPLSSSRRAT